MPPSVRNYSQSPFQEACAGSPAKSITPNNFAELSFSSGSLATIYGHLDRYRQELEINSRGSAPTWYSVYGHGTNAYSLICSLRYTNLQLVPGEVRLQYDIPFSTGESKTSRPLNMRAVSTVLLSCENSDTFDIENYANRSASLSQLLTPERDRINGSGFLITLENADEILSECDQLMQRHPESTPLWRAKKQSAQLLKSKLEDMPASELRLFQQLSRIPIICLGDGAGNKYAVNSFVANEVGFDRLNIRCVAIPAKYLLEIYRLVSDNLRSLNYQYGINLVTFEDLSKINTYRDGNRSYFRTTIEDLCVSTRQSGNEADKVSPSIASIITIDLPK